MSIEILGYIAAVFGSTLKLPQIYKTISIKDVKALSLFSLFLELICSLCWIIYSIIKELNTVLLGNSLYCIEVFILLLCYFKWYKKTTNLHINNTKVSDITIIPKLKTISSQTNEH